MGWPNVVLTNSVVETDERILGPQVCHDSVLRRSQVFGIQMLWDVGLRAATVENGGQLEFGRVVLGVQLVDHLFEAVNVEVAELRAIGSGLIIIF